MATTEAEISTHIKNVWLLLSSSSRIRSSSESIPSEVDEDGKATDMVVIWLTCLAIVGVIYLFALGVCILMSVMTWHNPSRRYMSPSPKLTDEEKQNGKRKLLIPTEEIQEQMHPVTYEGFARLVKKAIPPSPQPETRAK
jgi:hypothetical protein